MTSHPIPRSRQPATACPSGPSWARKSLSMLLNIGAPHAPSQPWYVILLFLATINETLTPIYPSPPSDGTNYSIPYTCIPSTNTMARQLRTQRTPTPGLVPPLPVQVRTASIHPPCAPNCLTLLRHNDQSTSDNHVPCPIWARHPIVRRA